MRQGQKEVYAMAYGSSMLEEIRLSDEAIRRLAAYEGARKPAIEAAIALAPFSFRVQLYSHIPPLIANRPDPAAARAGIPTRIELTAAGEKAIWQCARQVGGCVC
jgi:hypothetical protein